MRVTRLFAALLLTAGLAACESSTFVLDGPLAVRARDGALEVRNETDAPVYLMVIERESSAVVDWIPCRDPQTCDGLAPGEERTIRHDEIVGYEPGEREAVVHWWHLEPRQGGGFAPDSVRSEIVRL